MELREYRLDEVTINFDKKRVPLSGAQREKKQGKYRYYGAQGIIDYIDDFIFDGTYLLIAEDGENLKSKKQNIAQVVEGQFWVNNHAHVVQGNGLCDTRYLSFVKAKQANFLTQIFGFSVGKNAVCGVCAPVYFAAML